MAAEGNSAAISSLSCKVILSAGPNGRDRPGADADWTAVPRISA